MRPACAIFMLLVAVFARADETGLRVRDQYAVGDTLHVIVENTGDVSRNVALGNLRRVSDGFAPPLWWSRAEPEILPTGTVGRVSIAARRPGQIRGDFDFSLGGAPMREALDLSPTPSPLVVVHVLDMGTTLAIFFQNNAPEPLIVGALTLNGTRLEVDAARSTAAILPCETGVITATLPSGTPPFAPDQGVLLGVGTASGMQFRHAYVFRRPVFRIRQGEIRDAFICPTHRHGPLDQSAREIFALPRDLHGNLPEIHFCRNRLPEGLNALGQCLPRAIVNAQGSNPERGSTDAWEGLGLVLDHARTRVQPGIFSALVEPGSNFDGHYGQLPNSPVAPMSPRDLQYTIYTALAHGAEGLVFRLGDTPDPDFVAMIDDFCAPIELIAPWVETTVPVSLGATCDLPGVEVSTLYTGHASMLVMTRRAPGPGDAPAGEGTVWFRRPAWFVPQVALEIGGAWHESILPDATEDIFLNDVGKEDVTLTLLRGE